MGPSSVRITDGVLLRPPQANEIIERINNASFGAEKREDIFSQEATVFTAVTVDSVKIKSPAHPSFFYVNRAAASAAAASPRHTRQCHSNACLSMHGIPTWYVVKTKRAKVAAAEKMSV